MKYLFKKIEPKWQAKWEEAKVFEAKDNSDKPKFYGLVEFPYPSGAGMHVGHIKAYSSLEVISRKRRMEGYNVLFPIGFDAFGLPTENYAVKTGTHPRIITDENIKRFSNQLKKVGFSFDWNRVIDTTDEDYYKWTQWIFLKMFEKGLVFRDRTLVNYCPHCKVVLSNEDSQGGKCDICHSDVVQKSKDVWYLRITQYAEQIPKAIEDGTLAMEDVDEAVGYILRTVLYYETRKDPQEYTEDILACPEHIAVAKRAAEESMVLLKNENHVLPLDKEKTEKIVVLGVLGDTENIGDHGSSKVHPYYTVTPFKGLMKKMPKAQILYNDGSDLERAKELAADADAVVIVAGYIHSDEGEYLADRSDIAGMGGDRASMRLHQRDIDLIHGVKGVNPNTVVCIIGSSAILIDEWEKDVPAIIFSFYSGMEGGNVLADILFGDVCPSGKLPYTVALSEDSYPDFDPDCTYAEYEYYHGYCKMDKENIPVLYPFGYGLSYTTFDISEPTVEVFDKTAKISVNVKNTGDVKGAEVVQLYIGCEGSAVDRPVKILKDFARVELMPGEEKKVSLQVSSKDMAYYSEEKDDFVEEDITYIAYTGDCSCKEALKSVKFEFGK